jgi:two-component sensor histidine kinase
MPIRRILIALLLLVHAAPGLQASQTGDSLRYLIDSDATAQERVHALCRLVDRSMSGDPTAALAHAAHAVRLAEGTKDPGLQHMALVALRNVQQSLGMVTEEFSTTLQALERSRAIGDPVRISTDLQALATAYQANHRTEKSVEQARMALAMLLPTKDEAAIAQAEVFLLRALLQHGAYEETIRTGERVLVRTAALAPMEHARARSIIARALIEQGRYGDALPYLAVAGRSFDAEGTPEDRFGHALGQAMASAGTRQFKAAAQHLAAAEALLPAVRDAHAPADLMRAQHKLAVAEKDWVTAHGVLERLQGFQEQEAKRVRDLSLAGMQVMYDLKSRDDDNHQLRDRNARTEALLDDQRASNRYLSASAALLLVLLLVVILMARQAYRSARRIRLKGAVIQKQKDEIHAKNMDLQRQNMRLADALMREERQDIVLSEIHHRVKNNLQVIDALLHIQCGTAHDERVERMLRDAQGRLRAMALVHTTIYRLGDEAAIPVREHIEELSRNILVAFGRHDRVSVAIDAERLTMHAQDLMPLSLVVNELLTNSIKHAFNGREHGSVHIVIRSDDGWFELRYCDDGPAAKESHDLLREGSFGLQLLRTLALQLNGELSAQPGPRLTFCLRFKPDHGALRQAS